MKHDPLWLFENRPKKFERFVKKRMQRDVSEDSDDAPVA